MKTILLVDDEIYATDSYVARLRDRGLRILLARTLAEAKQLISDNCSEINIVVTDVMMPPGEGEDLVETHGGYRSGMTLARWIKQSYSDLPVVALTMAIDREIEEWFLDLGYRFVSKLDMPPHAFARYIEALLSGQARQLRNFIVHGHDEQAKYALKNYLQNTLKLPEPIILHEQPNLGRTIIEKFEDHAVFADLVCVLLTPDDTVWDDGQSDASRRRARQNVIFELGYFLGKIGRRHGRVLLLHKGSLELPSDISGLVYIDITNDIETVGELIRREIDMWLRTT